jgi:hypothetical protein
MSTRVRHTVSGVVSEQPDHILNHPTLGKYFEVVDDSVDTDCIDCGDKVKPVESDLPELVLFDEDEVIDFDEDED